MRFPPEFWTWAKWRDQGAHPPRPAGLPTRIPVTWWARYLIHRGIKPKPEYQPSLFSQLGGFVAQAGSFPPDTESARAFQAAGGKWLAVQFGDPATDQLNRQAFLRAWPERWRALGVQVGCWWRVEHVGIPVPNTPPVDFRIPNPEQAHEMERLPDILRVCREKDPTGPLAVITLGKAQGFPTGLLYTAALDAHLIAECFLEQPWSDTNVPNSVRFWLDSRVPLHRVHCCLLAKPGYVAYPVDMAAAEAKMIGARGLSSFTAENTPASAWKVMA